MLFSVAKIYLYPDSAMQTPPECLLHTFTREEAHYQEDQLNALDNDPGIYYETFISDTVDRCDFCGLDTQDIIWLP